jgi:hypothetical protein
LGTYCQIANAANAVNANAPKPNMPFSVMLLLLAITPQSSTELHVSTIESN